MWQWLSLLGRQQNNCNKYEMGAAGSWLSILHKNTTAMPLKLIALIYLGIVLFPSHIKLWRLLYFWKWLTCFFFCLCTIWPPCSVLALSLCFHLSLPLQLSLSLAVKLLSVVVLSVRGAWECWLSLFHCWAGENKQGWKTSSKPCTFVNLPLPLCPPVLLCLPPSARDQTNLTSGLKVQLTQTRTSVERLSCVSL